MPPPQTRADSLREYLTGAAIDGGAQTSPLASLGNYRSATEAASLGITLTSPLTGVTVLFAAGGNPVGAGTLTAMDANNLTWQPAGVGSPGPPTFFSGPNDTEVLEGPSAGQYLRVSGTTPFAPGVMGVLLATLYDNFFGFDDVSVADAAAGLSEYRCTIIRNESPGPVAGFQRWLATLGTAQVSNGGGLPGGTNPGTILTTGSFATWPTVGWCQVYSSGGALKEVVYYSSRSNTTLTVPGPGRALLGTTPQAGAITDTVYPVPGVALALDPAGVQAFGSHVQTVVSTTTPPAGVVWNRGVSAATGLQVGSLPVATQAAIWLWRQIPAGAVATPAALVQLLDSFSAY